MVTLLAEQEMSAVGEPASKAYLGFIDDTYTCEKTMWQTACTHDGKRLSGRSKLVQTPYDQLPRYVSRVKKKTVTVFCRTVDETSIVWRRSVVPENMASGAAATASIVSVCWLVLSSPKCHQLVYALLCVFRYVIVLRRHFLRNQIYYWRVHKKKMLKLRK